MPPTPTTFWRLAGMSYSQYVTKAASTVRAALKEPAKSKAMAEERFAYNGSLWASGKQGPKTEITKLSDAGTSA